MYDLVNEQGVCRKEYPRHGGGIIFAISCVLAQLTKVGRLCVNFIGLLSGGAMPCTSTRMLGLTTKRLGGVSDMFDVGVH